MVEGLNFILPKVPACSLIQGEIYHPGTGSNQINILIRTYVTESTKSDLATCALNELLYSGSHVLLQEQRIVQNVVIASQ